MTEFLTWIESQLEWARSHPVLLGWLVTASAVMFFGTLIAIPIICVRMPSDYFCREETWLERRTAGRPWLRAALIGLKNIAGLVLVVAGIVMLVTPGQGVITILVGVSLLDVPAKRTLELAILRERHVHRGINWMRRKAGRGPLKLPDECGVGNDASSD